MSWSRPTSGGPSASSRSSSASGEAVVKVAGGVAVLIIALLVLFFVFRGDDEADAEARYDGVHLCSPSQQADATAQAGAAGDSGREPLGSGEAPYFAQNSELWGNQEYDHGGSQDVGCGQTIAQCGCAMTSVATVMHLFEVVTTPGGDALNPATMNEWFNRDAQLTAEGWVSGGYFFGNVVWTAINGWAPTAVEEDEEEEAGSGDSERADPSRLSGESEEDGEAAEAPPPQGVRFKGWGTGSEDEIRRELEAGRPVVLEVPGHYIAAVALQEPDIIVINDPAHRERTTLDAYAGRILSSRLFEPSDDFRSIMVSVPAHLRIEVTDEQGRKVGTLGGSSPAEANEGAAEDIPGAVYEFQAMWRDPFCTERAPPDGSGINTVFISLPESGTYTVVVINPDGGTTAAGVFTSEVEGAQHIEAHEGGEQLTFEIDYDAGAETPPPVTPTATPTTTPTPEAETPTPDTPTPIPASVTPEPPTATPTDTATVTPTPTATTVPLDITSFTATLDEVFASDASCRTVLTWTVTGNPAGTVKLLKQFGTSLNNNTAEVLFEGAPGPGMYFDPFLVGPWTYRVLATSPQQITSETLTVRPICIRSFSAKLDSDSSISVSRHIQGEMPGATYTITRGGAGVVASGTVVYGTTLTFIDSGLDCEELYFYTLRVFVAGRTVTSNQVSAMTADCIIIF